MPITNESIKEFKANLEKAKKRHKKEWDRDDEKPMPDNAKWSSTKCLNGDRNTPKAFRTLTYYMFRSDAVLTDLLVNANFEPDKKKQIAKWRDGGRQNNQEVEVILNDKLKCNQYYKIFAKTTPKEQKKHGSLTKQVYYLTALAAYVKEFELTNLNYKGYYYSPLKNMDRKLQFINVELDLFNNEGTVSGVPDESPDTMYKGEIKYYENLARLEFRKNNASDYPSLSMSIHGDAAFFAKSSVLKGTLEMSIPSSEQRISVGTFLHKEGVLSEQDQLIHGAEFDQIQQYLNLYRKGFRLEAFLKARKQDIFKELVPINFLKNYIGTYFGYEWIKATNTCEIFIFRLNKHYNASLEHTNILAEGEVYNCQLTPLSESTNKIEVDVLQPDSGDSVLKMYVRVAYMETFQNNSVPIIKLHRDRPEPGIIVLQRLSKDATIRKENYIRSAIVKINEVKDIQTQAALLKLLKSSKN